MEKRFLVPHWHASTARMGALTRTAIGIRRKRKETEKTEKGKKARKAKVIIRNISTCWRHCERMRLATAKP